MILLPRYRTKQPVGPVEIDRGNPITRGLATVYLPTVRYPGIDLITRVFDTATTRGVLLPSTNGVVYSTTTSSNWSLNFAPVGITASYPALSVFTLFEQYDTTSTGAIFGGGNSATNYARFVKNNDGSILFGPNTNTGGANITGPVLNANQVYALAAVNEGNLRELFYDGVSVASSSSAITFLNAAYGYAGSSFLSGNQRRIGIYCGYVWTRRLTVSEIKSLTDNPWQIFRPQRLFVPVQAGGAALTLTADSGTYSITGQTADLYYNRAISADAGAYSLDGQAAQTLRDALLSLDAGSYAITGQDASFVYGQAISADAGDYSITGQIADLTRTLVLSADSGAYSIAGQDANLSRSLYLNAVLGSYNITGENATLVYEQARVINGDAGSYAITGQAADLTRTYVFSADAGSYSISGQNADFALFRALSLDAGSYDILGQDADLLLSRSIDADFGVYNISGQNADLLSNRILYADAGSYGISGQDALLAQGRYLLAESGSYAITGQPATLNSIVLFPNPADVRAGVVYGPDGIYTGTLVATSPIYLFDD